MKLTLIGTSHGAPEPNRKCSCTMVEVGQRINFFDMGTSGIEPLVDRGIPVSAVQGIFITHMHGDHTNGLVPFMDLISWYYKDARPEIFLPKVEAATLMESWLLFNATGKMKDVNFHTVQPGVLFDDGFLKVTAIRTKHCDISYAYLLEAEGKSVALVNVHTVKPIDAECVTKYAQQCGNVITVEEHSVIGGLGDAVADVLMGKVNCAFKKIGVQDCFGQSGKAKDVLREYGLTADQIAASIKEVL